MWGTDLTSVMTGEGQAAVFITVDHCSAECVGIHASRSADRFQALEAGFLFDCQAPYRTSPQDVKGHRVAQGNRIKIPLGT